MRNFMVELGIRRMGENIVMLIAAGKRWADLLRETELTKSRLQRALARLERERLILKIGRGQWVPICTHCGTPFTLLRGVARYHHNHEAPAGSPVIFHP
jgi:hypothetical protein